MATKTKRKKIRKSNTNKQRIRAIVHTSEHLLGRKVADVSFPGGSSRESVRLHLEGDETVIASRRKNRHRAAIEIRTLSALGLHHVPAPRLLATDKYYTLIQQELIGERLSLRLNQANTASLISLLGSALDALLQAQTAGQKEGLHHHLPTLGDGTPWIEGLLQRPHVLGDYLEIPAPQLDHEALISCLQVTTPQFVKWDSRPGNALVDDAGQVYWFDWEHAGVRNALDDMAWLLGDEFVPHHPDIERQLIEEFAPRFATHLTAEAAKEYLYVYGTFHMLIRLGLILSNKRDRDWWDLDYCIRHDKVGITLECAQRCCLRAAHWAEQSPLTRPLSAWCLAASKQIEAL